MDLRRQQISQTVEEVQKIIHLLTTEISHQDSRFEAVPVSDTHNENIKVSRALPPCLRSSREHPGPGTEGTPCVRGTSATESVPQVPTDPLPGTVYAPHEVCLVGVHTPRPQRLGLS